MSKYLSVEDVVLRHCDYCHRKSIQRIGITDYCELHLLMELLELQDATGMNLVKVAIGGD
ncbi:MAG: hypothetical protein M3114_03215 [Thermoproteota archaeon]|nr:hypothetical protein [Thermoproteota archaeon]